MPGLLDYVIKGYTHGGGVDFDPYADTTQAQLLEQFGIDVDADSTGLLPTYDATGADIAREAHRLRGEATRGQATGSLLDLTQQSQQQQAGAGFAGAGAGKQAYQDVREDVVTGFGQAAEQQYLDLQRDISGIQKGYESELLSAIGDLPEESWRFGAGAGDDYDFKGNEDCFRSCDETYPEGGQRVACYDACGGGGDNGGDGNNYAGTQFGSTCFIAGTLIQLPSGIKFIEDIKVGDVVTSFDVGTSSIVNSKVTETFVHSDRYYMIINGIIKTTSAHPFYSDGKWIEAGSLSIGDKILHVDGLEHTIETIELSDEPVTVYNFEVDGTHNYFAEGYLVHNKIGGG